MPLDERGKSNDRYGKCRRLRSLKADHTHVDDDGAVRALLELEDLRHLGYHDSVSAVFEALQQQPHRTFGVATLSSTKADLTDEVLHSALLACPRISHLYLTTYSRMGPASFSPLAKSRASSSAK